MPSQAEPFPVAGAIKQAAGHRPSRGSVLQAAKTAREADRRSRQGHGGHEAQAKLRHLASP